MTNRIFKTTFSVALMVLILCISLIMGVLYDHYEYQLRSEMKNEAVYISKALENEGVSYFEGLKTNDNRITWVDRDGTVIYDSYADVEGMENHKNREEIATAFLKGEGESSRFSKTLDEKTLYYALKINDGTVLRVASTQNTLMNLVLGMLQPILVILILAIVASAILASKLSKRIVAPLNNLDLDNPRENMAYDELSPLLSKISRQNTIIESQMAVLKKNQQEFTAITENMSEGFIIIDSYTEILAYNKSALNLLGAKGTVGKQSVLTLNRSESFRKAVDMALSGAHSEESMQVENRFYDLIANPVYQDTEITGAVVIILDVTEREQRENLRREFTANVSHELKTPLTSIFGFAEILKEGIVKPEDTHHFAGKIYDETQRLITLVNDIIKLSKLDEDSVQLEKETIDLYDVAAGVIRSLESIADKQGIELELQGNSVEIEGVKQIIGEMIYNLCDNAIKYNKKNGKVTVKVAECPSWKSISVSDTGIGISKSDQERVFERFYRVDKSHSKEIGGTGLGLSIVKHGAIYHGASIAMESIEGGGTTITISWKKCR